MKNVCRLFPLAKRLPNKQTRTVQWQTYHCRCWRFSFSAFLRGRKFFFSPDSFALSLILTFYCCELNAISVSYHDSFCITLLFFNKMVLLPFLKTWPPIVPICPFMKVFTWSAQIVVEKSRYSYFQLYFVIILSAIAKYCEISEGIVEDGTYEFSVCFVICKRQLVVVVITFLVIFVVLVWRTFR